MSYIDGFVIPVPADKKEDYREMAAKVAPVFKRHGAVRTVECWGNDLPEGKVTDFRGAGKAEPGETVVFSWVVWPSKEVRDAGMAQLIGSMRTDPRMDPATNPMPFDGARMIFGGFRPVVEF